MADERRIRHEIGRRRTFAIISHPDAGKTTLTEKLLLMGGVIELAGAVKAKRGQSNVISDWMELERERGISITTSVMQFPYRGLQMNLLDTPGHADFSEDTYRTLHAVDGAVMLLDCANGVEAQTRKLFRVCRHRSIPLFTFVNKIDRPGRDPFDLVGEVEDDLGIGVYPVTWPVFARGVVRGVYHRLTGEVHLIDARARATGAVGGDVLLPCPGLRLDDPRMEHELDSAELRRLREEIDLLDAAGDAFDRARFDAGDLSPMFFGSAMRSHGLRAFLDVFCDLMPPPGARMTTAGLLPAEDPEFRGFVFKVQANMNRAHRDRVAFVRICTGRFERGMKVRHVRLGRELRLANPAHYVARERSAVEEAFAGDVVGVFDPGIFEVGDTLTGGSDLEYEKIPSFAPERFARMVSLDPLRRKQLTRGTEQLAKEGTIQLYRQPDGMAGDMILGAVGQLQMEVTKHRLQAEYGVEVRLEPLDYQHARWVSPAEGEALDLETLRRNCSGLVVVDVRGRPVVLFEQEWSVRLASDRLKGVVFAETAQGVVVRDT